jgi:hypothetical protein
MNLSYENKVKFSSSTHDYFFSVMQSSRRERSWECFHIHLGQLNGSSLPPYLDIMEQGGRRKLIGAGCYINGKGETNECYESTTLLNRSYVERDFRQINVWADNAILL